MRPPWVLGASSIQRRILKTVLERLTLFSPLELEDIALEWGSRSTVGLHNVLLNTANFNVPFVDVTLAKATNILLHVPSNPLRDFLRIEVRGLEMHVKPTRVSMGKSILEEEDVADIGVTDFTSVLHSTFIAVFNSLKVTILNTHVYFLGLTFEIRQIEYEPGLFTLTGITANSSSMGSPAKSANEFSSDSEDDLEQSTMFTSALASSLYESAMAPPLFSLSELKVKSSFPFQSMDLECNGLDLVWSAKLDELANLLQSIIYTPSTLPLSTTEPRFIFQARINRARFAHENLPNFSFTLGCISLSLDYIGISTGHFKGSGIDWIFQNLEMKKMHSAWTVVHSSGSLHIGSTTIDINPLRKTSTIPQLILSVSPLVISTVANSWLTTITNISLSSWGSITNAVVTIKEANVTDPSILVDVYAGYFVNVSISDIDLRVQQQDVERIKQLGREIQQILTLLPKSAKAPSKRPLSLLNTLNIQSTSVRAADVRAKFSNIHLISMPKFVLTISRLDLFFRGRPVALSTGENFVTATFTIKPLHFNLAISEVGFTYWPDLLRLMPSSGKENNLFNGHIQVALTSVIFTLASRSAGKLRLYLDDCGFYLSGSPESRKVIGEFEIRKARAQLLMGDDVADVARLSSMRVDLYLGDTSAHISVTDAFLIIETCADSTKLAQSLFNDFLPETKKAATSMKYKLDMSATKDIFDKVEENAFEPKAHREVNSDDNSFEFLERSEPISQDSSVMQLSDEILLAESLVDLASSKLQSPSLHISGKNLKVLWNLHDGFDWSPTRDIIEATIRKQEKSNNTVGDFLFNSMYIEIPQAKSAPKASKSFTTTRSEQQKVQIDGSDICMEYFVYPSGSSEVVSSGTLQVGNLEIIDNVPTSTWKKFTTYDSTYPRRYQSAMVTLELLNVLPVATLLASEGILKIKVLPLRLHIDQDTLDFLARFFEFEDDKSKVNSDGPFFQRVEVEAIRVRLDYKPKKVNYMGLRSGHTKEFMNFFILNEAVLTLRHTILYGVPNLTRIGTLLNDVWLPDIRTTQLASVIAGVAPIRSFATLGTGVRDLVVVPMREYKKDGNATRSFQTGATQFWKTASSELVKLGAKVAAGTQGFLEGAEDLLLGEQSSNESGEIVSLYADQPANVTQGLQRAYASLARNLATAKETMQQVPDNVREAGTASGLASAVAKAAPVVVIRPLIGASEAVRETLMGVTNAMDPNERKRIDDKYKRRI